MNDAELAADAHISPWVKDDCDDRSFINLSKPTDEASPFYGLSDKQFQSDHAAAMIRQTLFLSNYFNSGSEFCPVVHHDNYTQGKQKKAELAVGPPPVYDCPSNLSHLFMEKPVIMFGGEPGSTYLGDSEDAKPFHQPPHADIAAVQVGKIQYTVDENPDLFRHLHPGTLIVSLEPGEPRTVYVLTGDKQEIVTIHFGQALWLGGGVTHGGCIIYRPPNSKHSWRIALHVYYQSLLHKTPPNTDFEVDSIAQAKHFPQMMRLLDSQLSAGTLEALGEQLIEAAKGALTTQGETSPITSAIEHIVQQLEGLLPDSDSETEHSSKKARSDEAKSQSQSLHKTREDRMNLRLFMTF